MSDPRLNARLLERVASASGGRVVPLPAGEPLVEALRAAVPSAAVSVRRDLWHTGWSFAIVLALLAAEWLVRRKYGLR
jgi:hypothetical protein